MSTDLTAEIAKIVAAGGNPETVAKDILQFMSEEFDRQLSCLTESPKQTELDL
jgi:hypothetical protein